MKEIGSRDHYMRREAKNVSKLRYDAIIPDQWGEEVPLKLKLQQDMFAEIAQEKAEELEREVRAS